MIARDIEGKDWNRFENKVLLFEQYNPPDFTNNSIVIRHLRGEEIYESNWYRPPGG